VGGAARMIRRTVRRLLLPLAAVAALALSGCGSLSPYAAKVNGERISQGDLEAEMEAILGNRAYLERVEGSFQGPAGERAVGAGRRTLTTAFVAALLDRQISFELVRQEVARRAVTVTDADRQAADQELEQTFGAEVLAAFPASYTRRLADDYARVAALERVLAGAGVTDEQVREFYEANAALFRQQACSRHILVPTAEAAAAVRARIEAGEDFAAIARAESTDTGSAAEGGSLGCQARGTFVPEFEAALDSLAAGQVSQPVQTQFGYHVIELLERKDVSLAEAAPAIRRQLEQQAGGGRAVARFVNQAVGRADIAVNPRYGSFARDPAPGVTPPPSPGGPPGGAGVAVTPGPAAP